MPCFPVLARAVEEDEAVEDDVAVALGRTAGGFESVEAVEVAEAAGEAGVVRLADAVEAAGGIEKFGVVTGCGLVALAR